MNSPHLSKCELRNSNSADYGTLMLIIRFRYYPSVIFTIFEAKFIILLIYSKKKGSLVSKSIVKCNPLKTNDISVGYVLVPKETIFSKKL